jgi:hypothetical protein
MATNTAENVLSHQIFQSTDGADNCSSTGVPDTGDAAGGGTYTGAGKLYYSRVNDRLIEPIQYLDASGAVTGIGVGTWSRGDSQFTPHKIADTTMFAHWPAIALDSANNVYAIWDDNPVDKTKQDACGGSQPLPNNIKMAVSRDFGATWSTPITVAHTDSGRVFWPWIVAGDAGKVSVVWYQSSKVVDVDCEDANITIGEAHILNALAPSPTIDTTVPAGRRPIHVGSVCQGGTACVAENKDRRLGDFFTNALDSRGCVLIVSGDTTQTDPTTGQELAVSLPVFIQQTSGESLVGGVNCATGLPVAKPGSGGQCTDVRAPVSTLTTRGYRRTSRAIKLHGRSSDRGCAKTKVLLGRKGRVESVLISIAQVRRHDCRFLGPKGRLEAKFHSCKKPILMPAKGTTSWRFTLRVHSLPGGNYRAVARGVDASQNKERPSKRRNVIRFRIG